MRPSAPRTGCETGHDGGVTGQLRSARPEDYDTIAAVVDDWWGRPVLASLPRLFLDLFYGTSLVVDGPAGPEAFLVGLRSPSDPQDAYIQFVGVAPAARRRGLARRLYAEFFRQAEAAGCTTVSAVTAPRNARSIDFHRSMGFTVTGPVAAYNGPGREMIVFRRALGQG
jgi:ribosomal protein S18 acetylase RimI-like enzyme